jgi:hypothetical protein
MGGFAIGVAGDWRGWVVGASGIDADCFGGVMRAYLATAIAEAWRLDEDQTTILFSDDTRVRLLYGLHATLADLFVDPADEARWLRDKLPALEGLSPLEDMLSGKYGLVRVHDLVERMAGWR